MSNPAKRRTRVARAVLLAGTLIALFVVAELAVRLHPLIIVMTAAERPAGPDGQKLERLVTPLQLASPNAEGLYKGRYYRSNSLGFRGPEYSPKPESGRVRILLTGDSVAMGDGVDEAERYSSLLPDVLAGEHRVEVINAAVSGANIDDAMNRLAKGIEAYSPDIAVYGFTINDIDGPAYRSASAEVKQAWRERRRGPFPESRSAALRLLSQRIGALSAARSPRETWYAVEVFDNYDRNPEAWRALTEGFGRFARILEEYDLCGHVFVHTHLNELGDDHAFSDIYARVAEVARARGIATTISYPDFAGRDGRSFWVSSVDPHPNARGHTILADGLARGLVAEPTSCFVDSRTAASAR